jgi:6-pyruvoyl-tetrahydropterin synthase
MHKVEVKKGNLSFSAAHFITYSITAERLAEYICGQFIESVKELEKLSLASITVGVEEAPGQTAFYRHSF